MVTEVTYTNGKKELFQRCFFLLYGAKDRSKKKSRWVAQRGFGRSKLVWLKDEDVAAVKMEESDGSKAFDEPPQKVG